jgi:hypothetical protein
MRLKHARAILGHHLPPFIPSTRAVARAFLCVPSIIDSLEVRFLYPARWWRRISEAQGPHREMRSEGSLEQSPWPDGQEPDNEADPAGRARPPLPALIPIASSALPALLAPDLDKAADLARQEKAKATRRAYKSDFAIFEAWCASRSVSALPAIPESVAAFLACEVERDIRSSTIGRRVAAIRYAHKLAGYAVPTDDERVKATVRGIRRTIGTAARKKAPATAERVIAMAFGTGAGLKGLRDRALLLLGFAGAFRRSELVALDWEGIEECETGLRKTIIRKGTGLQLALCPARSRVP